MNEPYPDRSFLDEMVELEAAYLHGVDPVERSGFGGGAARWEAERKPLIGGINRSGTFLDVGCANGWLAACVVEWCAASGIGVEPFGVDLGPELIAEARIHHTGNADNFWSGDAWAWAPPRRFTFVYSLLNLAPEALIETWLRRLADWVEPGGRLIVGSYGSKSRGVTPSEVASQLEAAGLGVVGSAAGGSPPIARFAWAQL